MNIGQSTVESRNNLFALTVSTGKVLVHSRDRREQEEESSVFCVDGKARQWMDAYDIHQLCDNETFLE